MDTDQGVESKASPEQQARAAEMGWLGPEKYKGDPGKFVDADLYIERGESFIPFLKKERENLRGELEHERTARLALETQLKETRELAESLEERYTVDTQKKVEAARRTLKEEIRAARRAGDFDRLDELTDSLEELDAAEQEAAREPVKKVEAQKSEPLKVDPEVISWTDKHSWVKTDKRKASIFYGFCEARRADGDRSSGKAFLDAALKDMEESLEGPARGSRVAPARNGSGSGGSGGPKGQSFSDMPADAQAACNAEANRFVGKGKKYATKAEWQTNYAQIYFKE